MKTATKTRLPRLARILESYLRLFTPGAIERLEFLERSKLKGKRIQQLHGELERMKSRRGGATLTEVLMSLLVFALGVVPLVSLFVVSTLRTVEATRKTAAADLAQNADATIDLHPYFVHNPDRNPVPAVHFGESFAFDPLGWVNATSSTRGTFGPLVRYPGEWKVAAAAWDLCGSPNNWAIQAEGFVTKFTPGTLIPGSNPPQYTPSSLDFAEATGVAIPATAVARLSVFDSTMIAEQSRAPVTLAGTTVTWPDMLPGSFVPSRARIEIQDRKYSWLATVRHGEIGIAQVSIVVFAGRGFDPSDETAFPSTFKTGSTAITLTAPAGRAKRGKWIFEALHGRWYQVAQVTEQTPGVQLVTLESPAIDDGTVAMLLPNIVDVFPLRSK